MFAIVVITSATAFPEETSVCNLLFDQGLKLLHLRKPQASREVYEQFIQEIRPCYRNRIVVHDYYDLFFKYKLRGIHLKSGQGNQQERYRDIPYVSISCHSLEEIRNLPFSPVYCFLSPVYDSISKKDYPGKFENTSDLHTFKTPVIALGGITPDKIPACKQHGFSGAAVLGYIWEKPEEAQARFKRLITPETLSIAGFDPSSGAGITADLKTLESCGVYGLGATTAITYQNEIHYEGTQWVETDNILRQCKILFQNHRPEFIKIGLIRDIYQLKEVLAYLRSRLPEAKIIWDPILKTSSGFNFHTVSSEWLEILENLFLVTPNAAELKIIFGTDTPQELQKICRRFNCHILWKGGHNGGDLCTDRLISPHSVFSYTVHRQAYEKHGTGCILSSAITAYLALGYSLPEACNQAQLYVAGVIASNNSLLGYHFIPSLKKNLRMLASQQSLQYITAPKNGMSICEQVEAVCRGGIRWVQLRMKDCSEEDILKTGRWVKDICRYYGALFIVNDNVSVARELNADGVHLGKDDMNPLEARKILGNDKIIGTTCNTFADVQLRSEQNVDYIGLGPFRFTTTKQKLSPVLGLEGYRQIREQMEQSGIHIPVFAIGGIVTSDIPSLLECGIQGIALSGVIKDSPDLTSKSREILSEIKKHSPFSVL